MNENDHERSYPREGPVNSTMYNMTYVVNQAMNHGTKFGLFHDRNLTSYPFDNAEVPYVISVSNRGQTYKLASNPYHSGQLWSFCLTPETVYMCGFFHLCSPNSAVQDLYKRYWEALSRPGVLKIGIMARVGDSVFQGKTQSDNVTAMQLFFCYQGGTKSYWLVRRNSRVSSSRVKPAAQVFCALQARWHCCHALTV